VEVILIYSWCLSCYVLISFYTHLLYSPTSSTKRNLPKMEPRKSSTLPPENTILFDIICSATSSETKIEMEYVWAFFLFSCEDDLPTILLLLFFGAADQYAYFITSRASESFSKLWIGPSLVTSKIDRMKFTSPSSLIQCFLCRPSAKD